MTSPPDVQNVPDVWALLEQARDSIVELERAFVMSDYQKGLIATLSAALAQRDRFVLVPKEPGHDRLQLIFDWVMGNEADDGGHYWGTSDQVAKAKEFWAALLAAAPKPDGKP